MRFSWNQSNPSLLKNESAHVVFRIQDLQFNQLAFHHIIQMGSFRYLHSQDHYIFHGLYVLVETQTQAYHLTVLRLRIFHMPRTIEQSLVQEVYYPQQLQSILDPKLEGLLFLFPLSRFLIPLCWCFSHYLSPFKFYFKMTLFQFNTICILFD